MLQGLMTAVATVERRCGVTNVAVLWSVKAAAAASGDPLDSCRILAIFLPLSCLIGASDLDGKAAEPLRRAFWGRILDVLPGFTKVSTA